MAKKQYTTKIDFQFSKLALQQQNLPKQAHREKKKLLFQRLLGMDKKEFMDIITPKVKTNWGTKQFELNHKILQFLLSTKFNN